MAKLLIFGIGDAAALAHYYFSRDTDHQVAAFTVDRDFVTEPTFLDLPVIEFEKVTQVYPPPEYKVFIAVGYSRMNHLRAEKYFKAKEFGYEIASYISSRCTLLSDMKPGENCFIMEGNIIQPYVQIGNNVTLWSGSHIGHHSVIDDHCFLAPRVAVSGRVLIGQYCFIGANVTIRNGINIAPHSLLGAGAVIMKNTAEHSVYISIRTEPSGKTSSDMEI